MQLVSNFRPKLGNESVSKKDFFLPVKSYMKSNGHFEAPKNCPLDHISSSEFWILENLWWIPKNQSLMPSKLLKRQFLTFWYQPKSISRKIRSCRLFPNFSHGVLTSQCTGWALAIKISNSANFPWNKNLTHLKNMLGFFNAHLFAQNFDVTLG